MILEQVLTRKTQFHSFRELPGQLRVEPRIGRHKLRRQGSDEIGVCIPGEAVSQLKMGAQLRLVARIGTLSVRHARRVVTAGIAVQMHLQKRVTRAERPTRGRSPIYRGLETISCAMQIIAKRRRENKQGRDRVGVEK